MSLAKIMVLMDPERAQQPAFERALESARMTGARLHLYVCLDEDYSERDKYELGRGYQTLLDEQVIRAQEDGVEATTEIDWASQ